MRLCLPIIAVMGLLIGCEPSTPVQPKIPSTETKTASANGMCSEHGVPQDLCTKCNPALAQVFKAKGDWCAEHEFPESFCPVCHPDAKPPDIRDAPSPTEDVSDGQIEGRVVRFVDPQIEEQSGIKSVEAIKAEGSAQISCSAELGFNANKVADIRAIVPGVVRKVSVELGQNVKKGDALFVLESTRIGDIQANLRTANERVRVARANLERQRELRKTEIASARQVEVAESELASAESAAQAAGSTLRMAGAQKANGSGRFTLRSPIPGQVVRRPGVMGGLATQQESLATVADTSTMWAMCAIPERDAGRVQVGHSLKLQLNDGTSVVGKISWISPEVDARTRMVNARAEVPNPEGLLRANQFLNASIIAGAPRASVVVPRDAVQRIEGRDVVFVRVKAGTYLPRVVNVYGDDANVAVEGKVKEGDQIVTDGAVFLRTEVLPGSIGAGCCEVEPPGGD